MTARGGDGVEVHFVPPDGEGDRGSRRGRRRAPRRRVVPEQHRAADDRTPPLRAGQETDRLGKQGYWRTFWDDDEVFYGHVLGCKGLERPAVVLCLNEKAGRDRSREKLYVGMSRATDQLIVVGDPDIVLETGGPAVAAALGIEGGGVSS